MHTVELLPDPGLDAVVRRAWRRLSAARLPSLADHVHPSNRPHLTLAEAQRLDPGGRAALAGILDAALPLTVRAGALGVFLHRGVVLFLALVPAPELVAVHQRVLALLEEGGCEPLERSRPGVWVPHVTLASRLPRDRLPAALDAAGDVLPVAGTFTAARSYDTGSRGVTPLAHPRP